MTATVGWNRKCNHLEEAARQQRLELLYERAGRGDKSHPQHSLYTGLFQEAPSAQALGPSAPEPTTASLDQVDPGSNGQQSCEQQLA
jgi:hypothetical protein